MVTTLGYSMTCTDDGYVARCEDLAVEASGRSPLDAIWELRMAIERTMSDWYMLERHLPELPAQSPFGTADHALPAPVAHA
jgi:hypothetical protein